MSAEFFDLQSVSMQGLEFSYEPNSSLNSLLHQVTCELPIRQVVRLQGQAGAGKSAVLKLMAGLLSPQMGSIYLNGQAIEQMSFEEFLPYRLRIGYSFDLGGLLNNRTLRENLALPMQYHKRFDNQEIDRRVEEMLGMFQLQSQADKRPSNVAGSQRKATCVARALIMSPQFLILDDPTTGLSATSKIVLSDWIQAKLKSGELRFVLLSSEEPDWLSKADCIDLEVADRKLTWTEFNEKAKAV